MRLGPGNGLLRQAWVSYNALVMRLDPVECVRGLRNVGLGRSRECLVVCKSREKRTELAEIGTEREHEKLLPLTTYCRAVCNHGVP